ncbi:MAG: NAD(P)/FAD-dependent oxidoreductase, partial [Pseudomonadota bacterium]
MKTYGAGMGLDALGETVARDLANLCRPAANWVPPRQVNGEDVVDVVVIGGGMCGLLAYFALQCGGMRNVRVLDRAPEGAEGPWVTYARMETLRSPKQLVGPAFGMGSLTFRAWFTAQFGEAEWEALDKIPRVMWMDYLKWYRRVLDVPVENGVHVETIVPDGEHVRLHVTGAAETSILARKVVMATGREGLGHPSIPSFVEGLPADRWAHSSHEIDFAALTGKRVVVVGVGASAVDNAAEALEHGAAEVRFLIRRKEMPTVNKMMGIGSFGFTCGFAELPDEWRWRFMRYSFVTQTPAPRGSTMRVSRHDNATFHFGKGIDGMAMNGSEVSIAMVDGSRLATDFVILGTGFTVDPLARTEFGDNAEKILVWGDRYRPPPGEEHADLANFPYLSPDFSFMERVPGEAPFLRHIHAFNYGATVSLGKVSGDIPGVSDGAAWLS